MGTNYVDEFSFLKKACLDLNGKWRKVSSSFCEYLGYTEKELLSIKLSYISHPDDLSKCRALLSDLEESPSEFESRFIHKSGKILWANIKTIMVKDLWGLPDFIAIYVTDITRYRNSNLLLEQQVEWIQQFLSWYHIVDYNPLPILISVNGVIKFVNQTGLKLYGAENEKEMKGKFLSDLVGEEAAKNWEKQIKLDLDSMLTPVELNITKPNGEKLVVVAYSVSVEYEGNEALQTVLHDITPIKKKEEQTTNALEEKETLLKEIHHRVKNNLAVISGLLELQLMDSDNETVQEIIRESQLRIQSMAMIHEKLYKSPTLSDIEFGKYARELVEAIANSYQTTDKDVAVHYNLDEIELDITKVIPAALVLNELVSNCYKYAFPDKPDGRINITIKKMVGEIMMSVSDNGVGIPDDFSMQHQETLGMRLIKRLSMQLKGEITYESINGTTFTLNFPTSD